MRALVAAPLLVVWAGLWLAGSRAFGQTLETLGLGLSLAVVVFAASLAERVGARRAWPVSRVALLVALLACVGTFGAVLQATSSGIDVLQEGAGVARVEKGLTKLLQRGFASGLRLPAAMAALLASAAAAKALLSRPRRPRVVASAALVAGALGSYPALWAIMGAIQPNPERLLLALHAVGAIVLGVELAVVARRTTTPATATTEPAPGRRDRSGVDLALALGVVFALLLPRGWRLAEAIGRANRQAEAQQRLELALATSDEQLALRHLDASISLWDDPRARLERGLRRAALGSIADAEDDLQVAALRVASGEEDDGLRAEALAAWGDAVFFDYDRALTALDKYAGVIDSIEHRPELVESHAGLARHALARSCALHVALRDDVLAQQDATRLFELEFNAPGAWLRRGVVRAISGDADGARDDLARGADSGSPDGAHAALWAAALWGEGGTRLDDLVTRPDWLGAAARVLAPPSPEIVANERDLLTSALAARDDPEGALASALAWLGAQAERAGDTARAKERYAAAVAACARRAPAWVARPHPGDHLGGLWAWRRLEALR